MGRPGTGWPRLERELPQRLSRKQGRARGTLQRVGGFEGARDVQSQVLELRAQGMPGDAQQEGGPALVPAGVLQDAGQQPV